MFSEITREQLIRLMRFMHPEKSAFIKTGLAEHHLAEMCEICMEDYLAIREDFRTEALHAAEELLADPLIRQQVRALPFCSGQVIVGQGDSITDDLLSWLEIMRHLLVLGRPDDEFTVVNAGISGRTSTEMIAGFLAISEQNPDWIITLAGTNDARRHGLDPLKSMVSAEESKKNFAALRHFAVTQTNAKLIWMTPPFVIEQMVTEHWMLSPLQLSFLNKDLMAIGKVIRQMPDPVVDLAPVIGNPPNTALMLDDGLHPSLEGQKMILRALLGELSK